VLLKISGHKEGQIAGCKKMQNTWYYRDKIIVIHNNKTVLCNSLFLTESLTYYGINYYILHITPSCKICENDKSKKSE
jgi:hypothetical protein